MIMLAPFSEPVGWLSTTNFTRALEPTLSWNQLHSSSDRIDTNYIGRSRNLSVNAFHEKAGRSQGNSGFIVSSWFFSLTKFFSHRVATVAMLPFALSRSDLVARCMLGVLNSAGAAICLATCHFT